MNKKEKKEYESPRVEVTVLDMQPLMMRVSGLVNERQDYTLDVSFDQSDIGGRQDYLGGSGFDQSDVSGRNNYGSGSNSASSGWSEE